MEYIQGLGNFFTRYTQFEAIASPGQLYVNNSFSNFLLLYKFSSFLRQLKNIQLETDVDLILFKK